MAVIVLFAPFSASANLYSPFAIAANNSSCSFWYGSFSFFLSNWNITLSLLSLICAAPQKIFPFVPINSSSTLLMVPECGGIGYLKLNHQHIETLHNDDRRSLHDLFLFLPV